jgi:arsenate reductase
LAFLHAGKKKVLFVCIHNSARSQMAEGFLRKTCGEQFDALSVGLEPGTLNPVVVRTMSEVGIDISGNETQSVGDILTRGESFDHVITVCDEANAKRCPVLPGPGYRYHWGFPNPYALQESDRRTSFLNPEGFGTKPFPKSVNGVRNVARRRMSARPD